MLITSYEQAKKVLKHGQRVKCVIYNTEITDARISIDKSIDPDGSIFICQNKVDSPLPFYPVSRKTPMPLG